MESRLIVVGADFADTGDDAIRAGLRFLREGAAQSLHVVHVLDVNDALLPPEERERTTRSTSLVMESLCQRVRTLAELEHAPFHEGQVHIEVRTGDVLTGLLGSIRRHRADLAIVGTHGRQGIDRWLAGSIAERLVRAAECSVLVARPPRGAERAVDPEPPAITLPAQEVQTVEPAWRPSAVPEGRDRR